MQSCMFVQDMPAGQLTTLPPDSHQARDEAEHLACLHYMIASLSSQRRDGLK